MHESRGLHKEAHTQHWLQGATLAEKLWGSKEDLAQISNCIRTIKPGVWGPSWNTEDEEEEEEEEEEKEEEEKEEEEEEKEVEEEDWRRKRRRRRRMTHAMQVPEAGERFPFLLQQIHDQSIHHVEVTLVFLKTAGRQQLVS